MKYIKGAGIITEVGVLKNHVLGFDGKFQCIIPESLLNADKSQVIDANGMYIAPGLIDPHIHGCGGKDTMDGTVEALETMSRSIAKNGVTSFLATTMTMGRDRITKALDSISEGIKKGMPGAQLLGAHMEGPFINVQFKGAQNPEFIQVPNWELVEPYRDVVKLITMAPELPNSEELIAKLRENHIVVSMGHSGATYAEAKKGINAGVSHCTHLFNAMTAVHHRNPGVASAALSSDVYCELIADTIHVHPGVFELVKKAKGIERIILITDCIEAGGMGDGNYSLGGQPVIVKDGAARLADGTLAGSVLKLNEALRNFLRHTSMELHEVVRMATLNPAIELGIDKRKGSIAVGKDADFFIMDEDFNVKATFVNGNKVFSA